MAKRFDVCSPRPRKDSDKPYWHRVGTAFEGEKGMNLVFDSLPLPDKEGRVSVFLFEAKEKGDGSAPKSAPPKRQVGGMSDAAMDRSDAMDDSIPF